MKRIFLTGATGVMGSHGLKELVASAERYEITVLARDSRKNRKMLSPYINIGVKVIWGDLLDKEAIALGVSNADIVLHVGGMVSPSADWYPEKAIRTNVGSMHNIIEAALPRKNDIKVVYVGSVSQYGPHYVPDHWGKCGDPLFPALLDAYAYSKIEAERLLLESDLRWWVSLRQTAILHSGLLMKASDPISFHVPLQGVLEWVTAEDSGRLLERICRDDVPDSFWCKCYNIGGGAAFRLTNYEFECQLLETLGCPPPEKIFNTNWFATKNFHGMWFEDSDELEGILHFRSNTTPKQYFKQMKSELPWFFSLAPLAPPFLIKMFMGKVARTHDLGPMWWIENNVTSRINAAWGCRKQWENIPGWKDFNLCRPSDVIPVRDDCKQNDNLENDAAEQMDPNGILHVKCDKCGLEYIIKVRSYVAGHRCPNCLKSCVSNEKSNQSQSTNQPINQST